MALGPKDQSFPPAERRGFLLRRVFVMSDLIVLWAVIGFAAFLDHLRGFEIVSGEVIATAVLALIWVPIGVSVGLYHVTGRGAAPATVDEIGAVARVATVFAWLSLLLRAVIAGGDPGLFQTVVVWIGSMGGVLLTRAAVRDWAQGRDWYRQDALIVGFPDDVESVRRRLVRHPEWGIRVVGAISPSVDFDEGSGGSPMPATGWRLTRIDANGLPLDAEPLFIPANGARESEPAERAAAVALYAGDADLDEEVAPQSPEEMLVTAAVSMGVSRVVIASPPGGLAERTLLARALAAAGVQVDLVAGDAEVFRSRAELHHLEGLPVLSMPPATRPRSLAMAKRVMDLGIAIVGLIFLAPLLAICALAIKLDSEGPVFFRQTRVGRKGKHFQFVKLRSMVEGAEERLEEVADLSLHGQGVHSGIFKVAGDPRVTRVGAFLRRWSLDEVPQLWNVVRGEMSIVGPRPLPIAEDERITGHLRVRHDVRPGITGPWQVMGRSNIPFESMARLDYAYVVHWSLAEDFRLILHTIKAVLRGRGAY